ELDIQMISRQIIEQELEVKKTTTQITRIESDLIHLSGLIASQNDDITLLKKTWQHDLMSSEDILKMIKAQEVQIANYRNEDTNRANIEGLTLLKDILKSLSETLASYQKVHLQRRAMYEGNDIGRDTKEMREKYLQIKETLQSLKVKNHSLSGDISQTQNKIESLSQLIMEKTALLGYESIESALNSILDEPTYQNILSDLQDLSKLESEINNKIEHLNEDISRTSKNIHSNENIETLRTNLKDLNDKRDQIHQRTGALQNELKLQEQKTKEYDGLMKSLYQKEKDASPLFHLNLLIGDATGNKYAKYAQNLSLRHLIQLANRRMKKLTDRYLLVPTEIEDDLRIMDIYQGNTERSVKTLSGGETFIVSLAMALSLADMSSKNVKIESLFIDEGFGTLDEETLETALATLERLQSESSRTIGIISHVESLKERISTQIKVNKSHLGYSWLEIVGQGLAG
ncbi:MAG: SbcC/MukB-like Walker B domain-containing protein, partial [Saprospiraceae bacterium]